MRKFCGDAEEERIGEKCEILAEPVIRNENLNELPVTHQKKKARAAAAKAPNDTHIRLAVLSFTTQGDSN